MCIFSKEMRSSGKSVIELNAGQLIELLSDALSLVKIPQQLLKTIKNFQQPRYGTNLGAQQRMIG
jgi:hypothetical protein